MKLSSARVLWSIDPFSAPEVGPEQQARALARQLRGIRGTVVPVTVLAAAEIDALAAVWSGARRKSYLSGVRKAMQGWCKAAQRAAPSLKLAAPKILPNPTGTRRLAVEVLLSQARAGKFDLLALSTHGRRGIQRLMLGSFAEAVLSRAPLPLLVLPSQPSPTHSQGLALFASDLSEGARRIAPIAGGLAHAAGLNLVAFHAATDHSWAVATPGFIPPAAHPDELKARKAHLSSDLESTRRLGVETEIVVRSTDRSIAEAIVKTAAAKKADRIILNTTRTPGSALLLGSTARQVARLASCPVWVFRSGASGAPARPPRHARAKGGSAVYLY
ncbi:MAG: universal stress protein [Bdellovibrionales bacterium]|nr:universal stress protein [Bdellovibrionales bacterium]